MITFYTEGKKVIVQREDGKKVVVAKATDSDWARILAWALRISYTGV